MNSLREKWEEFLGRPRKKVPRHRVVCFVVAAALAIGSWFLFTQRGELARRNFMKGFGQDYQGERIIKVYNDMDEIACYIGHYSIEMYAGKTVIYNRDTHEITEVYGDGAVIVDSAYLGADV